jgi:polar amino acid transport system substrate-binding protein
VLSSPKLPTGIALAVALTLLVAACGSSKNDTSSTATTAGAADCTPAKLATQSKGQLTVATDKPAYPPYFENDDPSNGEGFESAVAYAIGKQLGYSKGDVVWTVEPFNASFAPGPKDFDFDVP